MTTTLPARRAPAALLRAGWFLFPMAALCGLAACSPKSTPEQQVRAVIATAEAAAEERDLSALMALVSPRYQDERGGSAVELTRTLRGYFLVNQSVHLLTRVESIEFPYKDFARVQLTVGTLGNRAQSSDTFDLAADVHDVQIEMQLERGEWKVTRASWQPVVST